MIYIGKDISLDAMAASCCCYAASISNDDDLIW